MITSYPSQTEMFSMFDDLFTSGQKVVLTALQLLIIGRAVISLAKCDNEVEFWKILRDTFGTVILLLSFSYFLSFTLQLPEIFSSIFGEIKHKNIPTNVSWLTSLQDIVNWISLICFYLAGLLYFVVMVLTATFGAYVICYGMMFGSYGIIKSFYMLIVAVSCWPLAWHACNLAITTLSGENGVINSIVVIFFSILKALAPASLIVFLKNPVANAAGTVANAAMKVSSGGAAAASGTFNALGGKPISDKVGSYAQSARDKVSSNLEKTIPTIGKVGKSAVAVGAKNLPSPIRNAAAKSKDYFSDRKDLFSGKTIPNSSPLKSDLRQITNKSSDAIRSIFPRKSNAQNTSSVPDIVNKANTISDTSIANRPTSNNVVTERIQDPLRVKHTSPTPGYDSTKDNSIDKTGPRPIKPRSETFKKNKNENNKNYKPVSKLENKI